MLGFLNRLSQRLKSSPVAKNSGASYFAFISTSLSGLLSIPVAVAYLEKDEIGLWAAVSTMVAYLLWMDLGIGVAAGRLLAPSVNAKDRAEVNRWWSVIQVSLLILGIIVMLLALASVPLFFWVFEVPPHLRHDAQVLLVGCAVISGINFPLRAIPGFLTAENRFHWVPICQGLLPWVQVGGFYLMLRMGHGMSSYVWGTAASQLFVLVFYRFLIHKSPLRPRTTLRGISMQRIRSLLSFSLNLSALGLTNSLLQSLPTMILARHGGLASIPIYIFSCRAATMASGLVGRNLHAFYPSLLRLHVSGNREEFMKKFKVAADITLAFGTIGAGGILVFNEAIVSLLAGPTFFAGISTTAWLALGVFITPLSLTAASLLQISGSMGKTIPFTVLNLVVVYFASIFAFQRFGMPGLAGVFTLQVLGYSSYAFARGCRNLGYQIADFPKSLWITPIAVSAAIFLAAWYLGSTPPEGMKISIGSKLLPLPGIRGICMATFFAALGGAIIWLPLRTYLHPSLPVPKT
jgi:O-antigen/teichoic acid export membrane protein